MLLLKCRDEDSTFFFHGSEYVWGKNADPDFVQDENNFINQFLQVGSGSGGPKINGSGFSSLLQCRDEDPEFFSTDPDPDPAPDPT